MQLQQAQQQDRADILPEETHECLDALRKEEPDMAVRPAIALTRKQIYDES